MATAAGPRPVFSTTPMNHGPASVRSAPSPGLAFGALPVCLHDRWGMSPSAHGGVGAPGDASPCAGAQFFQSWDQPVAGMTFFMGSLGAGPAAGTTWTGKTDEKPTFAADKEESSLEGHSSTGSQKERDFTLKNTFINVSAEAVPPDACKGLRRVSSSPAILHDLADGDSSWRLVSTADGTGKEGEPLEPAADLRRLLDFEQDGEPHVRSPQGHGMASACDAGDTTPTNSTGTASSFDGKLNEVASSAAGSGLSGAEAVAAAAPVLVPALGSSEMPTRGSALHSLGTCKPCAFAHLGTCRDETECRFCHLCAPGEKKRRRKEWKEGQRRLRALEAKTSVATSRGLPPGDLAASGRAPHSVFQQYLPIVIQQPLCAMWLQQEPWRSR